jgi:hypothetical protein
LSPLTPENTDADAARAAGRGCTPSLGRPSSTRYVLMAVLLATVMFLSGICQPLQAHRLKVGLIVLAGALMAFGLYNIAVLPMQ